MMKGGEVTGGGGCTNHVIKYAGHVTGIGT